jgi:hypothetical protein
VSSNSLGSIPNWTPVPSWSPSDLSFVVPLEREVQLFDGVERVIRAGVEVIGGGQGEAVREAHREQRIQVGLVDALRAVGRESLLAVDAGPDAGAERDVANRAVLGGV